MVDYFSAGETYPVQDAIADPAPPDVPAHFNLTKFLSDSMLARQPWRDYAAAASRVLYTYVEQQRIALGLQRDAHGVARALKIATLKMMGLDWNSDALSDDDYDRMVESVALYNANHGTEDFISYMGYSLGVPLTGVELWTRDYVTFGPGPQHPSIFEGPSGVWYPTTHIGILYDQYSPNASEADVKVLTDIFYRVAPIHLVLAWVGTLVTLEVGPLLHDQRLYERSYDTAVCQYVPSLTLWLERAAFEVSRDLAVCDPLYPNREINEYVGVVGVEAYTEGSVALPVGVSWSAGLPFPDGMTVQGGYPAVAQSASTLDVWYPGQTYYSPDGLSAGYLCQPDVVLLQSASSQPQMSNWAGVNVSYAPSFALPDGSAGYRVSTTGAGGYLVGGTAPLGTDCVVLKFRPASGSSVALVRGVDTMFINTAALTATASVSSYGIFQLGTTGFYVAWAVMTGTSLSVLPGGVGGSGSIDWLDCQVLRGASYPAPVPASPPTADAYPQYSTLDFYGSGSVPTDVLGLPSGTDASQYDMSADYYGGDANYYFLGGVVLYSTLVNLPTASAPRALAGTQVSLPGASQSRAFGVVHVRARSLEPSALYADQTIFSAVLSSLQYVTLTLSGRTLTLGVDGATASLTLAPGSAVDVGLRWDASGTALFAGGASARVPVTVGVGGAPPSLLSQPGLTCTDGWVLESLLVMQSDVAALLPTEIYMAAVTAVESGG